MLSPEKIDALNVLAGQVIDPVTDYLLADIARRIAQAGEITSTAGYQIWKAQQLGASRKEIKKRVAELLKLSKNETEKLFKQSAKDGYQFDMSHLPTESIPFEKNDSLQQIVSAAVELAKDDFTNITQTIGMIDPYGNELPLYKAYNACCDYAFKQVFTGATDYNTAVRQACKNLYDKGLVAVDYQSGARTSLEAAVRRNIMGGLGLMQEKISAEDHDKMGADGWEISAHAASAPDHEPIQGKQYSDAEYQKLNDSLVRRIGTLNCGHAASPIILGVSKPVYTAEQLEDFKRKNAEGITYDGKHYTTYEATQMQRRLERSIRKCKREITVREAAGDEERLKLAQVRYTRLNQEYARFSKAAGLRTQTERLRIAGFDYKQGKIAVKAVEKALISVEKPENSGIIETKSLTIKTLIEQRHTGRGNPNAILQFGTSLNNRQKLLLEQLPEFDNRITVPKKSVKMSDLTALTAITGNEFALFTKGNSRLLIRGNTKMVNIGIEDAKILAAEGYRWSGHTHPGTEFICMQPSDGDYAILECFGQSSSVIYNSKGDFRIFQRGGD